MGREEPDLSPCNGLHQHRCQGGRRLFMVSRQHVHSHAFRVDHPFYLSAFNGQNRSLCPESRSKQGASQHHYCLFHCLQIFVIVYKVINFLYFSSCLLYFSFCLDTKRKDTKRKKSSAESPGLLFCSVAAREAFLLNGKKLASLKQPAVLHAKIPSPLYAPPLRREPCGM